MKGIISALTSATSPTTLTQSSKNMTQPNPQELVRAIHPQQAHIGTEYMDLLAQAEKTFARWGRNTTNQPVIVDAIGQIRILRDYFKAGVEHSVALDMWETGSGEMCQRCHNGNVYGLVKEGIEKPQQPPNPEMEAEVRDHMLKKWHAVYNDVIVNKRRDVDAVMKNYADHTLPRANLRAPGP